jgi:hypothetical protein
MAIGKSELIFLTASLSKTLFGIKVPEYLIKKARIEVPIVAIQNLSIDRFI